jgi:WD40 repeat protein
VWVSDDLQYAAGLLNDDKSSLWLFSVKTGQRVHRFDGYASSVSNLVFHPRRPLVITGAFDKTVRVFDLKSGRLLGGAEVDGPVLSIALAPDGSQLIASVPAGAVDVWRIPDQPTRKPGNVLDLAVTSPAHQGWLPVVKYAPDGSWIATIGRDARLKRWTTSFELIATFPGHVTEVVAVDISPDGRTIMTGDAGGVVRFWRVLPKNDVSPHIAYTAAQICEALQKNRENLLLPPMKTQPAWRAGLYLPAELAMSNVIAPNELFPCERASRLSAEGLAEAADSAVRSLFGKPDIANRLDCEKQGAGRNACLVTFDKRRAMARQKRRT